MSFGKSRRWVDWMPHREHIAPGQAQDTANDPRFSFVAAARRRGPTVNPNVRGRAGFSSSTTRPVSATAAGRKRRRAAVADPNEPPVYTQFKPPRPQQAWGSKAGTFGSSKRYVSLPLRKRPLSSSGNRRRSISASPGPGAYNPVVPTISTNRLTLSFATLPQRRQRRPSRRYRPDTSPIRGTVRPRSALVRRRHEAGRRSASRPHSALPRSSPSSSASVRARYRGVVQVPDQPLRTSRSHKATQRALIGSALDTLTRRDPNGPTPSRAGPQRTNSYRRLSTSDRRRLSLSSHASNASGTPSATNNAPRSGQTAEAAATRRLRPVTKQRQHDQTTSGTTSAAPAALQRPQSGPVQPPPWQRKPLGHGSRKPQSQSQPQSPNSAYSDDFDGQAAAEQSPGSHRAGSAPSHATTSDSDDGYSADDGFDDDDRSTAGNGGSDTHAANANGNDDNRSSVGGDSYSDSDGFDDDNDNDNDDGIAAGAGTTTKADGDGDAAGDSYSDIDEFDEGSAGGSTATAAVRTPASPSDDGIYSDDEAFDNGDAPAPAPAPAIGSAAPASVSTPNASDDGDDNNSYASDSYASDHDTGQPSDAAVTSAAPQTQPSAQPSPQRDGTGPGTQVQPANAAPTQQQSSTGNSDAVAAAAAARAPATSSSTSPTTSTSAAEPRVDGDDSDGYSDADNEFEASAPSEAAPPSTTPAFKVGDRLTAQFSADGRWHAARVTAVLPDGTLRVMNDDGDVEHGVPASRTRPAAPPPPEPGISPSEQSPQAQQPQEQPVVTSKRPASATRRPVSARRQRPQSAARNHRGHGGKADGKRRRRPSGGRAQRTSDASRRLSTASSASHASRGSRGSRSSRTSRGSRSRPTSAARKGRSGLKRPQSTARRSISRPESASRRSISRPESASRRSISRPESASRRSISRPESASRRSISRPESASRRGAGRPASASRRGVGRLASASRRGAGRPASASRRGAGRATPASRRSVGRPDSASRHTGPARRRVVEKAPQASRASAAGGSHDDSDGESSYGEEDFDAGSTASGGRGEERDSAGDAAEPHRNIPTPVAEEPSQEGDDGSSSGGYSDDAFSDGGPGSTPQPQRVVYQPAAAVRGAVNHGSVSGDESDYSDDDDFAAADEGDEAVSQQVRSDSGPPPPPAAPPAAPPADSDGDSDSYSEDDGFEDASPARSSRTPVAQDDASDDGYSDDDDFVADGAASQVAASADVDDDAAYGIVEDDESGEGYSDFDDDYMENLPRVSSQARVHDTVPDDSSVASGYSDDFN